MGTRGYLSTATQRAWHGWGFWELVLGGLAGAIVVVLGAAGVISAGLSVRMGVILAGALIGSFLLLLLVWAPYKLWDEQRATIEELTATPLLAVTPGTPFAGHARLWVINRGSAPAAFGAQVVRVEGLGAPLGPEAPWWIEWRHSADRSTTLYPNIPEMLFIGQALLMGYGIHKIDAGQVKIDPCDWTEGTPLEFEVIIHHMLNGAVAWRGIVTTGPLNEPVGVRQVLPESGLLTTSVVPRRGRRSRVSRKQRATAGS